MCNAHEVLSSVIKDTSFKKRYLKNGQPVRRSWSSEADWVASMNILTKYFYVERLRLMLKRTGLECAELNKKVEVRIVQFNTSF